MSKEDRLQKVAVIIATKNRCRTLSERALPSVVAQTLRPDFLIIADDSSSEYRARNEALVSSLLLPGCEITYQQNRRSSGASGSWNSATDTLFTKVDSPESVFVAILDDDDAWAASYLEECYAAACARQLDMVAADLRRFESVDAPPLLSEGPECLRSEDFLTGNPGIQGSNLFLRLSVLLAAGGFDEELQSTTDRDLCIRIADLGTVRYGRLPRALVDHFADKNRPRLSSRGSKAKHDGLRAFWRKYFGRMNSDQRRAFTSRAADFFDWSPPVERAQPDTLRRSDRQIKDYALKAPPHDPYTLYVGVITSDPLMLWSLLQGLAPLQQSTSIACVSVLILDNNSCTVALDKVVQQSRLLGLKIAIVSKAQQRKDAADGVFGKAFQIRATGLVGIAQARSMLQKYLGSLMEQNKASFGWILDDDMQLDDRARDYLSWLPAFREQGTDVLIGCCEGSSPNPPLNGLRVHLVDIFHNLVWLQNLPPEAILPDRSYENSALRAKFTDYYYDLSRKHSGHLEMPHWLEPAHRAETVAEARARLLAGAMGILSGSPLTRPIVVCKPENPLVAAKDSVNRGGSTFVLTAQALTHTPNTITRIRGREARRSDMVWAIVNRYYRRLNIKAVGFPVVHVGRFSETPGFDVEKVQGEIVGSALYAGLCEFLITSPRHQLDFTGAEIRRIRQLAKEHMDRRLGALEQSFYRIAGLREAIRAIVAPGELDGLLRYLERWFTRQEFDRIRSAARTFDSKDVDDFFISLRTVADDFAHSSINVDFIRDQLLHGMKPQSIPEPSL